MIGNDIVDLELAKKESNWLREGFVEKIFTNQEQNLIFDSLDPELMIWNLWSRKEAAYKIYNRQTGIRGYFPWELCCDIENLNLGIVTVKDFVYYTQTQITADYTYTIAVCQPTFFDKIKTLKTVDSIKKENGIPYILDEFNTIQPVSITHHGRYQRIISL